MAASPRAVWYKGQICRGTDLIFVTVGNDFRDFSRLIKKIDEIVPHIHRETIIQRGHSKYLPINVKYFDFVPIDSATKYIKASELVISHAGIGTIILCKENAIPLIILPRRKKYNEHMNDHQMEIAQMLEQRKEKNIYVVYEEEQLEEKIEEVLKDKRKRTPIENIGRAKLIKTIREFVEKGGS
jgi:beta-1,4-N-acetylglucosaminyltransferase